jgi:hypothetical protein
MRNISFEKTLLKNTIENLFALRLMWKQHFSFAKSPVSLDIILILLKASLDNQNLNVKTLFASVDYSDMGIRYHFNDLVDNGWIELYSVPHDRRIKLCRPSAKLESELKSI